MCFSPEASIQSLTMGLIGSFLCVSLGSVTDKIVGYFLGFVSLMQGVEYLLWKNQSCNNINRALSILGMVLNHSQPIVFGILVLLINPKVQYVKTIITLLIIYLLVIIPYSMSYVREKKCTVKSREHGHLVWDWNNMKNARIRYFIFIVVLCLISILGMPSKFIGLIGALGTLVTFTTSKILYPNDVTGALWCYYVAFIPFVYFLLRFLVLITKKLTNK
jgi:hypothetical protein